MANGKRLYPETSRAAVLFVLFGLVVGLNAEDITRLRLNQRPAATKTLSLPSDQSMGPLSLEPETGPGWDPEGVRFLGQWDYHGPARGDVRAPEDRHVKLDVLLGLSAREKASLRTQNPLAYQQLVANRPFKDPDDLSGLSALGATDLFWLSVGSVSVASRRTGVNVQIFEPISQLTGLQMLTLSNTGMTDAGLEHLRPLRSLRVLELTEPSIGTRGLSVLKDLPALEYLDLNTGVTDAGLKQVARVSSLRWLRLAGGNIWGPGLAELAKLPRLERLCIQQSRGQLLDRHVKYLEGLAQLKSLTFWSSGCDTLTDVSLASMGKLKSLEELHYIRTRPKFTPAGVAHLKDLKHLKTVHFAQTWSGHIGQQYGDQVAQQLAGMPQLESIKGISYLSAEGMQSLATLKNLTRLGVTLKNRRQGYQGPTGLSHLASLRSLNTLEIFNGDPLSDRDLASLESLDDLKELLIMGPVTESGFVSLGQLKTLERMTLWPGKVSRKALNHLNGLSNLQMLKVTVGSQGQAAGSTLADELALDLSGMKKMTNLNLSGLSFHDDDLACLKHMPVLENLMIQPFPESHLTGASLHYLKALSELKYVNIAGFLNCTGEDLANLNGLLQLRNLTVKGAITDRALASLTVSPSVGALRIDTDNPIRKETLADLKTRHPRIEYIHINELMKMPTQPVRTRR